MFKEDTFCPAAKLVNVRTYSIVTDYLGTPIEMYDAKGERTWAADYDIYGKIRQQRVGVASDCPFRYPGQYEDVETGLYYNRFRYYAPEEGMYVSQDPIGLAGGMVAYGYVGDTLNWIDPLGLDPYLGTVYRGIKAGQTSFSPSETDLNAYIRSIKNGGAGKMPGLSTFNNTEEIIAINEKYKLNMTEAYKINTNALGSNLTTNLDNIRGHVSIFPSEEYLKKNGMSMRTALEDWHMMGDNHSLSNDIKNSVEGTTCL